MSIAATAAAVIAQAQLQMALAAKLANMASSSEQSIVQLVESAAANVESLAATALQDGVGANLDVSA